MAIYSTKIEDNVVANNEATEADIMQEIDDMVENESFEGACHGIEAVIQLHENEMQLFDALIEADFISVSNEQNLSVEEAFSLNDKAAKIKNSKIVQEIKKRFEAAIKWIKDKVAEFIKKLNEFFDADRVLFKKYGEVLKEENLKEFKGIKNFAFPKKSIQDLENDAKTVDSESYIDRVTNTSEDINDIMEDIKKDIDGEIFDKYFDEKPAELWKPSSSDIKAISDFVSSRGGKIAKSIKNVAAADIKKLSVSLKNYEKKLDQITKSNSDDIVLKSTADIATVSSCYCRETIKKFNAVKNIAVKMTMSYRKAFLICGHYCAKQKGLDEATEMMVCEASDQFVLEYFAY